MRRAASQITYQGKHCLLWKDLVGTIPDSERRQVWGVTIQGEITLFLARKALAKFYGANDGEILDKHALANVASQGKFLETLRADRQVSSFIGDRPHYVVTSRRSLFVMFNIITSSSEVEHS